MKDRWNRLEEWFETNIPAYASTLEPPATERAVDDAERELGVTFPPSVRQSYLLHDGEGRGWRGVLGWSKMPLAEVVETSNRQREQDQEFDIDFWDHSLIPIFGVDTGDLICVTDAPDGEETPVRYWNHERADRREELAPSFPVYVDTILDALESGNYEYDQGNEHLDIDAFPHPW